jgi:DNA helicase IV
VRAEKEFESLQFNHSTPGKSADSLPVEEERAAETRRLRWLHTLLLAELQAATDRSQGALAASTAGEFSGRYERDVSVHRWSERVAALTAARSGLCFGRLDHASAATTYVGRIGLTDPADGESALVDWRAPAAQPFYCATLATPLGVTRRRHFEIAGTAPDERVADFHDDVLDGAADSGSASDPVLLAALKAPRGSTMRDIVSTIQAEQDAIIRLPLHGVVVIEGGPGTGKTAVALHRVAYLLYTHRERHSEGWDARRLSTHVPRAEGHRLTSLARSGVLVVGPSAGFIHYVGGVLPALGESAVVFTTPGRLAHGVVATAVDPDDVARTKGDMTMLEVLRRAVADRQELPASPIAIELDDVTVSVDRSVVAQARRRARDTGLPHNAARTTFRDALGGLLVDQGMERLNVELEDPPELAELLRGLDLPELAEGAAEVSAEMRAELRDDLRANLDFHAAVEALWPALTPERVLAELFASRDRLAAAGADPGLFRAGGAPWTIADAPLLDELAELLGPVPGEPAASTGPDGRYAAEVLDILESAHRGGRVSRTGALVAGEDADELRPTDFVTADVLAARQVSGQLATVAERAAGDRDWRYGHLVVDEAQELSAMDWHVLLRRCPTRSITAVGDLAQRSAPAGAREWADVLGSRWTHRTLTVNYRTPAEIMAMAAGVLAEFAPDRRPPESVRATGEEPWQRTVPAGDLVGEVRRVVDEEAARLGRGTLAVIAPEVAGLAGLPAQLHTPVTVKGLEFDVVVVVDPERIRAHNPADLYVAMTRATQRLGLLHVGR